MSYWFYCWPSLLNCFPIIAVFLFFYSWKETPGDFTILTGSFFWYYTYIVQCVVLSIYYILVIHILYKSRKGIRDIDKHLILIVLLYHKANVPKSNYQQQQKNNWQNNIFIEYILVYFCLQAKQLGRYFVVLITKLKNVLRLQKCLILKTVPFILS